LTTGVTTDLTTVLNEQPLFVQPIVKPGCTTGLTTVCIHDTAGCQTGCQIKPVVKPVGQQAVSCKRGFKGIKMSCSIFTLYIPALLIQCWLKKGAIITFVISSCCTVSLSYNRRLIYRAECSIRREASIRDMRMVAADAVSHYLRAGCVLCHIDLCRSGPRANYSTDRQA